MRASPLEDACVHGGEPSAPGRVGGGRRRSGVIRAVSGMHCRCSRTTREQARWAGRSSCDDPRVGWMVDEVERVMRACTCFPRSIDL